VTWAGVILSRESRLVAAEVEGRIDQLLIAEGQRVRAGETIAVLDDAEAKRELDAARGAEEAAIGGLRQAQAQAAEASRIARQNKSLFKSGAVSRDTVLAAQSSYSVSASSVQAAEGSVKRARAAREAAEQGLAKTTIVAPIDGVVTLVKVAKGQMAMRGQPIARVFDPADLGVRFAVPPEERDSITIGQRLTVLPAGATAPLIATVRVVNRNLEPPLRFAIVDADLRGAVLADRDAMLGKIVDVNVAAN
jgi:RND family efflux transporter MFP subunit